MIFLLNSYWKDLKIESKSTINESESLRRIKNKIIFPLLMGKLKGEMIINFEKKHCKIIKTEKGREYPRDSKTPFTKWYSKAYSSNSEIVKILRAIENGARGLRIYDLITS
jgi:hypothetical protein